MIFKKLSLKGESYTYEDISKIQEIVIENTEKTDGPASDIPKWI